MPSVAPDLAILTLSAFRDDRHAVRYVPVLAAHPAAGEQLLAVLNDAAAIQLMEHESRQGRAALRGIQHLFTDALGDALTDPTDGPRFRQAVGVAIRLRMELLGWATTGRKGPVDPPFTRAERYDRASAPSSHAARALATLDRIATIGTAEERLDTGRRLQAALAATRADSERPF